MIWGQEVVSEVFITSSSASIVQHSLRLFQPVKTTFIPSKKKNVSEEEELFRSRDISRNISVNMFLLLAEQTNGRGPLWPLGGVGLQRSTIMSSTSAGPPPTCGALMTGASRCWSRPKPWPRPHLCSAAAARRIIPDWSERVKLYLSNTVQTNHRFK